MGIITQRTVVSLPLTSDVVDEVDVDSLSAEMMNGISISYNSSSRRITLSAGHHQTFVNCNDFIKDGMVSNVELCGTCLVFKFNSDAGKNAISVDLSSLEEGGQLSNYLDMRSGGAVSGDVIVHNHGLKVLSGTFSGGKNALAAGKNSFAYGVNVSAIGENSHAEGLNAIANANYSHVAGIDSESQANGTYSYVWSGISSNNRYSSHGQGSFSINPKDGISGFYIGTKSFAKYLSEAGGDVDEQLARKLDKHSGGSISGDVEVYDHGLKILSGNYIQTNTSSNSRIYSSDNAFLQANIDSLYGDSYVGSKVFCVVGVISAENQIKLSGDVSILREIVEGRKRIRDFYENVDNSRSLTKVFENYKEPTLNLNTYLSDALFSMTIDDKSSSIKYRIQDVDVDTGIVTLASPLADDFASFDGKNSGWFIDKFKNDDNAFYLVGFPEIGNITSNRMFGQHAEGGSVRAIGRQTHVEGRDNVADIRYSHAEGSHNIAGDMASHAEGFETNARGRYSHAEGYLAKAVGQCAHAEGESTVASGKNSHAGGWGSKAYGDWSFAQGRYAEASSFSTVAMGAYVSAYATNTIAMGTYALADGKRAFVWNGLGSNSSADYYSSNGDSTFNINPNGNAKGFYIGLSSLDDYLQKNAKDAISYIEDNDLPSYAKASSLSSYMKASALAASEEMYGWINLSGRWAGYTPNAQLGDQCIKFISIPVSPGQELSISACIANPARICFLSGDFPAIPSHGQLAPVVGSTPFDNVVLAGQTSSVVVPDGASMLFCCSTWRGVNALPELSIGGVHVQMPSQLHAKIGSLQKSIEAQPSSATCNKFNKDDPSNVNNIRLNYNLTSYFASEYVDGSRVWGLTHFIPCKKGNVLIASRTTTPSNDHRAVVRGIQYFDKDFNQICCQQSSSLTGMTDFREVPKSSFVNRKTWWTQVSADACEYVKLTYAYQDEVNNIDMSSLFMVQVEPPNFTPTEVVSYVPFKKMPKNEPRSRWNGKKILFAGDSITRPLITQYSSSQPISSTTGLAKKGYAEFACDTLDAAQAKDGSTAWDGAMLALSSPDAQVAGRRSIVNQISSWPDDVDAVHVMIGTNDWNYSWPDLGHFGDNGLDKLSTFYGALDYACSTLLEKYPGKPIVFSTPVKRWQNGSLSALDGIAPSRGWIKNDGKWNTGAYEYKIIPVPYPNSKIEIKGSPHPSCDTWYAFLSCQVHTTGYAGVYAPTSPLSTYTPGQNMVGRGTIKTFISPPIPSYLWVTYSRNDSAQYGTDAGNAWPEYVKINDVDVTDAAYKIPVGLRYDMPNYKGYTLGDCAKAIRDVCGYYGIKVVDLFNECPINPIARSNRESLIPDGTHPTPKGHELIARYVAGAFDEIR